MPAFSENQKTVGIEVEVFVVPEVTPGTPVFPAGSDVVRVISSPSMVQNFEYLDDEQRRFTHSKLSRVKGRVQAGEWSIETYLKSEAAVGTEPEAHNLLTGLYGSSVTGGSDVDYSLLGAGNAMPTYTIWMFRGNEEVGMMAGCVVSSGAFSVKAANDQSSLHSCAFSGMGVRMKRAAADLISADVAALDTTIAVTELKKFQNEVFVQFNRLDGTVDDNGGAGYEIVTVAAGSGAGLVTVTPAAVGAGYTVAAGAFLEPFRPTAVESGEIRHGSVGLSTLGGETVPVLSADFTIENNIIIPNEVQDGNIYPSAECIVRATKRDVNGTLDTYFTSKQAKRFRQHADQDQQALTLRIQNADNTVAYNYSFPIVELDGPDVSGDEIKQQSVGWIAFASSATAEDETALNIGA